MTTSTRPYLLRAMVEWMLDNSLTPQLVVDSRVDGAVVPRQFVADDKIVLNIAPSAIRDLQLGNDRVQFKARFAGSPFQVDVPLRAVIAVFARESGAGMTFPDEEQDPAPTPPDPGDAPPGRPQLKVVK